MKLFGAFSVLGAIALVGAAVFVEQSFDPNQRIMLYIGAVVFGLVGPWLLLRQSK